MQFPPREWYAKTDRCRGKTNASLQFVWLRTIYTPCCHHPSTYANWRVLFGGFITSWRTPQMQTRSRSWWGHDHDDVIKWKQFLRYWPFVRGIQRSPVNSPHKGQWRGALMSSLICARIYSWVNNREAGDLRRHPTHCDVIVMTGTRFRNPFCYQAGEHYVNHIYTLISTYLDDLSHRHICM